MLLSVHVTSVLFLVRFNNFVPTMGFYWSYTLLLWSSIPTTDCIPKCDRHVHTYIHCKNRFLIQSFTLICSAVMNSIYWKLVQLAQTKIVWPKQCHAHEHACVVVLCRRDSSACMCAGIRFWRWSERACFVDLQPTEASPCLTTSRQTNIVLVVKMLCA